MPNPTHGFSAAANRVAAAGLSSFGSKPAGEVAAANPETFFQVHWVGGRGLRAAISEKHAHDWRRCAGLRYCPQQGCATRRNARELP
jgi:hypothetical protein